MSKRVRYFLYGILGLMLWATIMAVVLGSTGNFAFILALFGNPVIAGVGIAAILLVVIMSWVISKPLAEIDDIRQDYRRNHRP